MICRNGHQQPPGSRFCTICGTPLDAEPARPAAADNQTAPTPPADRPAVSFSPPVPAETCSVCGGSGARLDPARVLCVECGWLRPLIPGYYVDCNAFQWAADGKAMSALRSAKTLNSLAQTISEKVGRRWIEATFNGVLLSEKQLPRVYHHAVKAARILGMTKMPDVYVSGDVMWDCRTYGTDQDAFVVIGTALLTNFKGPELLFLFAREMGHCRAGHALWKTVIRFLVGEQGPRKGVLAGGIFNVLSPSALIEGAIEVPLLAWARQAEITADRAGMLAVGDEELARRVLLSWSLKSPFLYKQISVEAWLEQQAEADDDVNKLSELMTSSTPYITRRLKLMDEFARTAHLRQWRDLINNYAPPVTVEIKREPEGPKDIRLKCRHCGTPMRVPRSAVEGKEILSLKCPDQKCGKTTVIRKNPPPSKPAPEKTVRNESYDD